jgi:uncharacterized DUF497 family protein
MEFGWDPDKSNANLERDGISFHEGSTVFGDPRAITFNDPGHLIRQHRFLTFGYSRMNHLLAVVHTGKCVKNIGKKIWAKE